MVPFVLNSHGSWLNRLIEVKGLFAGLNPVLDSQAVHIAKDVDFGQHRFLAALVPIIRLF